MLFLNLWEHRELLWHLVMRSLKAQYKQSVIGYAWIAINPLFQFAVYNFVFALVLKTPSQAGVPFALFLFVGLVPWLFFTNSIGSATESIVSGGGLISAVYFPRELLVVAAVLTRAVDWIAGSLILVVMIAYFGFEVTWAVLWTPVLFLLYTMFTLGIAMPLGALNLFFRDVRYIVSLGLMLWFFITPILYPMATVPGEYHLLYDLNPNARFISAFRYALLEGVSPPLSGLLAASVAAVLALTIGYSLFKKMEPAFADRI